MSRFARAFVTSWILLALLATPVPSSGEPIPVTITGDSLDMHLASGIAGTLALVGDHGFTFTGVVDVIGGIFGPFNSCTPCLPGSTVSLSSLWVGNDLGGLATFEGVTYPHVGGVTSDSASGTVMFTGSAAAPLDGGLTGTVTAPFLFQGQFTLPAMGTTPAAVASLFGKGMATVELARPSLQSPWDYRGALYDFDPVPEPATFLLVGTTLAGVALRRRQAKVRQDRAHTLINLGRIL